MMFRDDDEEASDERQGLVSTVEPVFGSSAALFANGHDHYSERGDGRGHSELLHAIENGKREVREHRSWRLRLWR